MIQATMELEGGATRGVFTSGVLDFLMEEKTELSHVVSVSAGACNGVDYVSKQIGRTRDCMIHKEKEYNYYYGFRKFVKEKSILDICLAIWFILLFKKNRPFFLTLSLYCLHS